MIKILIVDDSPTEIALLKEFFKTEGDMEVIACAKNGEEAIKLNAFLKPDIITMDITMPITNGLEATRMIMSQCPTPIIIISSAINKESLSLTFQALEAGALSVLEKPDGTDHHSFQKSRQRIIDAVRTMSEIKVIKKRFHVDKKGPVAAHAKTIKKSIQPYEVIAIGSSVGGPQALKTIFSKLPENFPVPILVVQHMTQGFIKGFADWLDHNTPLIIQHAEDHQILEGGHVYFAPDQHHLEVKRSNGKLMTVLSKGAPISGFYPSITVLLKSVAKTCENNAVGILLTGMGSDGAEGLLTIKKAHGLTLIQDPKSAVVFGMAGVAQSMGAVDNVIELDKMADYLIKITNTSR